MAPIERDAPRDGDMVVRHLHSSSSDHTRALVPMWDSSDPERAPPPLPLNPQSPSLTSRAGTSSAIQSAHAALTEKARESSSFVSSALVSKRVSEVSPERPARGASHRRMQSLQTGTVRDLSLMIESGQTSFSPRSPEKQSRPSTPSKPHRDSRSDSFSEPKQDDRCDKPIFMSPSPSLTPIVRPTARRAHQSILGENTPPQSATMLALQNMPPSTKRESESAPPGPLSEVTNGSTALVKMPQSIDQLSHQILSLTNIATALQKEMSQLSRRSRDNATDLMSLKEATNQRDEDIRKNLRDLLHNVNEAQSKSATRDPFGGSLLLDNKPHTLSPTTKLARPFSLPRIPSPNSFAASIDRETMSTPSLYGGEAPATIALLERILREMGTREGQDLLISRLSEVVDKLAGMATAGKVEELLQFVKTHQDHSLVPAAGGGGAGNRPNRAKTFDFDDEPRRDLEYGTGPSVAQRVERLIQEKEARRASAPAGSAADMITENVLKSIRSVKDSVAQGGGLTAEVKALVRELRGEVLGMGREIGRRLDEVAKKNEHKPEGATKEEMTRVVEEGLEEMKQHMNHLLREHRRQSAASVASKASVVDYGEVYNAMRTALKDSKASQPPELHREDVIEAVRDAWENYKPEIQVEQLGLDRDEVLACLKEGLQQYAPQDERPVGATREEVFKAVVEGLKHFVPPQVDTPASLSRDEILEAVRECLEEFEFPIAPSAVGAELSRQDMVDAVKEGLSSMDLPSKSDAPLVLHDPAPSTNNDEVVLRLHEIMEFMREEFRAVSAEAKQNVAANGRDTEQVLDATKDGFEKLRADIESYVDRSSGAGAVGQEELMDCLVKSLDGFRDELTELVSRQSDGSKEMLRAEIESLRDTVNGSLVPASTPPAGHGSNQEILQVLQEGLGSLRAELSSRPIAGTNEVLDALQEGLNDIRITIDRIGNKPTDFTATDEILDALRSGLDNVRSDIGGLREESKNDRAVAPISDNAIIPVEVAKHEDIKALEVLIMQLRIKLEAMEDVPQAAQAAPPAVDSVSKEDLAGMEEALRALQGAVAGMASQDREAPLSTDPASREDVEAIETILRNTKSRLDDLMDGEQAVRKEHLDIIETLVLETRESLSQLTTRLDDVSRREDVTQVESLVTQVVGAFDEMKERQEKQLEDPERVTKTDMDAIEAVCLDVKSVIEQMVKADLAALSSKDDLAALLSKDDLAVLPSKDDLAALPSKDDLAALSSKDDLAALPSKDDLQKLEALVNEVKELTANQLESSSKAVELRDAENASVGERVGEVKSFLHEFQDLVKDKLNEGATGIDTVGTLLETLSSTVGQNANVGQDVKDMFETMKSEFEESKAGMAGARIETDERLQQTTETLSSRFDERIGELVARYDEFQVAMEERTKIGEARDVEMEAAVVGTKAVADELKSLIDALGSAVTDSLEKMEEASKTVFGRVEDLIAKADENHGDGKAEHELTREQVRQALGVAEGIQGQVGEMQPKILDTLNDVLLLVGQHYEHSKSSTTELHQQIEEAKPPEQPLLPPPEPYDDSGVHEKLDRLLEKEYDDAPIHEKLDKLVEREYDDAPIHEKLDKLVEREYDDAPIHEKLDKIMEKEYDDAPVHEKLDKLVEREYDDGPIHEKLDKIMEKEYDDAPIHEKLDKIMEKEYDDAPIHEKLDKLAEKEYDDSQIHEKLDKILEYDDAPIHEKLDKIMEYDDAPILEKLDKLMEYDDAPILEKLDKLMEYDDAPIHEKLDRLAEKEYDDSQVHEKLDKLAEKEYDDSHVHEKLDKLVDHTATAEKALSQLETLELVHQQVLKTAAEISLFVAAQTQRIADEHEDREKTLQETVLELERRLAQKEEVEATVLSLKEEEERLRSSVVTLRVEQESLVRQKVRLTGDVSALETALHLRREELQDMEARAEGLERRILEGVMDHSRILLMAKSNKGRDAMSRKRVPSQKPAKDVPAGKQQASDDTKRRSALSIAINSGRGSAQLSPAGSTARRILSLSQISSNATSGGFKRSQSVRHTGAAVGGLRKTSWGGGLAPTKGYGDLDRDKENIELRESEEEHEDDGSYHLAPMHDDLVLADPDVADPGEAGGDASDTETLRRSSHGTIVVTGAESDLGTEGGDYSDQDYADSEWTESVVGPESSLGGSTLGPSSELVAAEGAEMVLYQT